MPKGATAGLGQSLVSQARVLSAILFHLILCVSHMLINTHLIFKPTFPVKAYKFVRLVDRGKYRNTFQTDLSSLGKLPWLRSPRLMCQKY